MTKHERTENTSVKNPHLSPDNGQGMGLPHGCSRTPSCSGWDGGRRWLTNLKRDPHSGNWICPNCGASYGQE